MNVAGHPGRTRWALVGALALAATLSTMIARADDPPAGGTPLTPRPTGGTALAPAPAPQTGSFGWKLFLGAGVIAGLAYWVQRRRPRTAGEDAAQIRIVSRARIGLRADLVVVEVQGQTLLLGVGAQGIQNLALLDSPADARLADPGAELEAARPASARLEALLRAAKRSPVEDDEPPEDEGPHGGGGQAAGLHKWIVK